MDKKTKLEALEKGLKKLEETKEDAPNPENREVAIEFIKEQIEEIKKENENE